MRCTVRRGRLCAACQRAGKVADLQVQGSSACASNACGFVRANSGRVVAYASLSRPILNWRRTGSRISGENQNLCRHSVGPGGSPLSGLSTLARGRSIDRRESSKFSIQAAKFDGHEGRTSSQAHASDQQNKPHGYPPTRRLTA